jgi:large subunit ribosomal protein L7/L12
MSDVVFQYQYYPRFGLRPDQQALCNICGHSFLPRSFFICVGYDGYEEQPSLMACPRCQGLPDQAAIDAVLAGHLVRLREKTERTNEWISRPDLLIGRLRTMPDPRVLDYANKRLAALKKEYGAALTKAVQKGPLKGGDKAVCDALDALEDELIDLAHDEQRRRKAEEIKAALERVGAKVPIDYDVVLMDVGNNKTKVIQEISALDGIDLKEAKRLIKENCPQIALRVTVDRAEQIKLRLEMAGAKATIEPVLILYMPFEGTLAVDLIKCRHAVLSYWMEKKDRPWSTDWQNLSFGDLTFSEIAEAVQCLVQSDHFGICKKDFVVSCGDPFPCNCVDVVYALPAVPLKSEVAE